MGDEDEESERRLAELVELMQVAARCTPPEWTHKHFNRVLFTNPIEIRKFKRYRDVYIKENYLPEHRRANEIHPVQDVLFIGKVKRIKRQDQQVWLNIESSNQHTITVVLDKKQIQKCISNYAELHQEFRQTQRAPSTSSSDDLHISKARWLLARRRNEGAALVKEKKQMLNKTILILGKVAQLNYKRCIYMREHVLLSNARVTEFFTKCIDIGHLYETLFRTLSEY